MYKDNVFIIKDANVNDINMITGYEFSFIVHKSSYTGTQR